MFDNIGFSAIKDDVLRHLVVSRICHPQSKVATVDYLKSYFDEDIKDFVKKFDLKDFVIVADAGLLNNDNITELEENGYKYIVGARIKNENKAVTDWILSQNKTDGEFYEYNTDFHILRHPNFIFPIYIIIIC